MTDRISTGMLRELSEYSVSHLVRELAAEVIELRGLLEDVLDLDASIGTRSSVHEIARAALNHKETNNGTS